MKAPTTCRVYVATGTPATYVHVSDPGVLSDTGTEGVRVVSLLPGEIVPENVTDEQLDHLVSIGSALAVDVPLAKGNRA